MHRIAAQSLPTKLAVLFLAVGALGALGWSRRGDHPCAATDRWQVEDLVAHLRGNGMEFRTVPAMRDGPLNAGAFLTTTDKSWWSLNSPSMTPEHKKDWKDTVFCYKPDQLPGESMFFPFAEEDCLHAGPFVLYGDPDMLKRIRAALRAH